MSTDTEHEREAEVVPLAEFQPQDPETLERIAELSREQTRHTEAGLADLAAGTVSLSKQHTPDHDDNAAGEGLVITRPAAQPDESEGVGGQLAPGLRPLLPASLTDPEVWRQRRTVWTNTGLFHLIRSPVYAWRVAQLSAIGARVGVRDAWSYLFATEYGDLTDKVRRKDAGAEHIADLRADRRKEGRARRREALTVYAATGASTYVGALLALAEAWGVLLATPAVIPLIGVLYALGHREMIRRLPDGEFYTLTDSAADQPGAPLGADSITAALRRAGLLKDGEEVSLVGPVRAVDINAAEAVMDLPGNLTINDLIKHRDKVAAAFRVQPEWLDFRTAGNPGRVRMWMTSEDPFGKGRPSPLLDAVTRGEVRLDVWNTGVPVGYNRRGETIFIKLIHIMILLGGMQRTGKGMLLRSLICGLGLDPRINIRLVAGAKPGEHIGYAKVCATFFGRRPARLVALLEAWLADAYRREEYLEDQGRAKMSEADLEEFPLEVLIIDELKQYLRKGAPFAERIAELIEEASAFVGALNMTILLSTQDPDANTVPRGFKSNSGARIATRTGGPTQTNAILKEGATGAGLRAHDIKPNQKGCAIVDLDGAEGELIRSFFIEDEKYDGAAPIVDAGYALRKACGRAPGTFDDPIETQLYEETGKSSIGGGPKGSGRPGEIEGAAPRVAGIYTDLLAVFADAGNPQRLPTAEILAGLADRAPETWAPAALGVDEENPAAYAQIGGTALSKAIGEALDDTDRTLSVRSWTKPRRANGYYLDDIRTAAGLA